MINQRGTDVSLYQDPEAMRYGAWHASPGIERGQYRLTLGKRIDVAGLRHRTLMRIGGLKTGAYGVIVEYTDPTEQAAIFCANIPPDDENDDWLDAERAAVTEAMLSAWCDAYDARSRGRLTIYTGVPWWLSHVPAGRRARYAAYGLAIAGYPFDTPVGKPVPMDPVSVARRSNPPDASLRPKLPPPWDKRDNPDVWQFTGQGSLPGYAKFIDLSVYYDNDTDTVPELPDPLPAQVLTLARVARERAQAIERLLKDS